jgi:fatty acid desaturase
MSLNAPEGPAATERETVSNRFGTVTNLAVHYNVKKSLFAGTRREDLIMRHVVAARLATNRHAIGGALLALIGVIWLFGGMAAQSGAAIVAIIPLAAGILLLWGWPMVSVTAADGVARPSVSWPWTRSEAEEFVNGVSKELLARG